MNLGSVAITIATMSFVPFASMAASPTAKIAITGKSAQALALALLNSGFAAEVNAGVRTLKVDSLVMIEGIGHHECDDINGVLCGFSLSASILTAQQSGKNIDAQESVQLSETLRQVVDPILEAKGINNTDSGMGKSSSDYGQISCAWKVSIKSPISITDSICTLDVPNNGN